MTFFRRGIVVCFVAAPAIFAACSSTASNVNIGVNSNGSQTAQSSVKPPPGDAPNTNLEELKMLINVPYETEDTIWKEDTAHKKLIAVFTFSPNEAQRVIADAGKNGQAQSITMTPETWFPPELIAQSELSGDDTIKGTAYPATAFVQEPYTEGKVARTEGTDYFVLELFAK